jgi:hypothetical protein
VIPLAHVAGVPVEELAQPLLIGVLLSGAWVSTRLRRQRAVEPQERHVDEPSDVRPR